MLTTAGLFAGVFLVAYLRGQQEDRNEAARIKSEVSRLARLKKEFDEKAHDGDEHGAGQDTSDDGMAASLRAAQEKLKDKSGSGEEADDAGADGEDGGEDETGDGGPLDTGGGGGGHTGG